MPMSLREKLVIDERRLHELNDFLIKPDNTIVNTEFFSLA